jgi:hypothetical protein
VKALWVHTQPTSRANTQCYRSKDSNEQCHTSKGASKHANDWYNRIYIPQERHM